MNETPLSPIPADIISPEIKESGKESVIKKSTDLSKLFEQMIILLNAVKNHKQIPNKIISLNDNIKKIKESFESSKQKIAELQGGAASKLPILGGLIKLFFSWYNRKLIAQTQQETEDSKVLKGKYEEEIETLRQALVPTENERPGKIFDIESQMRVLLEKDLKDFPEKAKYQDIFSQKVLPLVQQAKQSITQRPFHFAAQAAAAKGAAAQAGLKALKQLAENKPVIQNSGVSKQEVFLLPAEGAVFKRSNERAKEEERLINDLFDLMSKQAVVGTFNIQHASADKFGIQFSEEGRARGLTPEDFSKSPGLRDGIKEKLSDNDRLLLEKHEATPPEADTAFENYKQMKKQAWTIKPPGKDKDWKPVSFSDLQKLHLAHKLPADALIGTAPESNKAPSYHDHLLKETDFARALNYLPALHGSPSTLYFSPDLSDPEVRKAYETCEKYQWRYLDENGKSHVVDFKKLHALTLQKTKMKGVLRPIQNKTLLPVSQTYYFNDLAKQALDAKWKAVSPELMHIDATGSLANLRDIQAKPFIGGMILMHQLDSPAKEAILKRLTPDAEFNAILTGEVQLLDMHSKNLGVAPQSNAEYERYKNLQFSIPSSPGPLGFQDFITQYLTGHIQPDTKVKFEEKGKTIEKPLKELPELQQALDVRWQFVIFDTDLSLSENNRLQLQIRSGKEQHLIPLRSVLLETSWKDQPLSKEAIQILIDSAGRDLRVANWIKRADASIYKQLSPSARHNVEQQLAPLIQHYTLREPRKNDPHTETTLKNLQNQFVQELSDITQPAHLAIWQTLEQDLSSVTVRPDDTWEKIAQRYHQDLNELKTLNPADLKAGEKIKIQYDLNSSSPKAVKKREKIAAQLFPRLTYCQQAALMERQQRRKDYLNNYQALAQSTLTGKELIIQIEQILQRAETPLTSVRKEELLNQLMTQEISLLGHPDDLLNLKQTICQECQLTYFNLMKAMYPLLADAYALNKSVYGKEATAGMVIGLYTEPLETTITHAHNNFPFGSPEARLAQKLEDQIANIHDPAFFGHWL